MRHGLSINIILIGSPTVQPIFSYLKPLKIARPNSGNREDLGRCFLVGVVNTAPLLSLKPNIGIKFQHLIKLYVDKSR